MNDIWVIIDNYDSFSHMLAYYLRQIHEEIIIVRNDEMHLNALISLNPKRLIISPGPHAPNNAGVTLEAISYFYNKIPILGICLGHQALGVFGGMPLKKALKPIHGKTSLLHILAENHPLFIETTMPIQVMRYHSLVVEADQNNTRFDVLARTQDDKAIMIIVDETSKCMGFQLHPESVLTPQGMQLLINWHHWCH